MPSGRGESASATTSSANSLTLLGVARENGQRGNPAHIEGIAMQLTCIHCGLEFSISAKQLGGAGRCPHCHGEIELPKAVDEDGHREHQVPGNWLENSVSMLGSTVFHLVIVMILALSFGECGSPGISDGTEEVVIGEIPSENLDEPTKEELKQEERGNQSETGAETLSDLLDEIASPAVDDSAGEFPKIPTIGVIAINGPGSLDGWRVSGGPGPKDSFDRVVQELQRNGLDIVLSFDSTGSMSGEISEVKRQIERVGELLLDLVPKTRISICTYRDDGDAYVVKGLPLTNDIKRVKAYLDDISAAGGGDRPEAAREKQVRISRSQSDPPIRRCTASCEATKGVPRTRF